MADVLDMIRDRKLAMITESQQLAKAHAQLNAQLQQVKARLMSLDVELDVLEAWRKKLEAPVDKPKEGE